MYWAQEKPGYIIRSFEVHLQCVVIQWKVSEKCTSSGVEVVDKVEEDVMGGFVAVAVEHLVREEVHQDLPRVQIYDEEVPQPGVHRVVDLVAHRVVNFWKNISKFV